VHDGQKGPRDRGYASSTQGQTVPPYAGLPVMSTAESRGGTRAAGDIRRCMPKLLVVDRARSTRILEDDMALDYAES
jgi:hypothetical protein